MCFNMMLRIIIALICINAINGYISLEPLSYFASFPNRMLPIKNNSLTFPLKVSLSQCASECLSRSSGSRIFGVTSNPYLTSLPCYAMEYVYNAGICILLEESTTMTSRATYQPLRRAHGTTFFELSKSILSLFHKIDVKVLPSRTDNSRMINDISLDTCADTCFRSRDIDCRSFAYNRNLALCAISNTVGNKSDEKMSTHDFNYYQYKGNRPICNVTIPWNYKPRIITSQGYPYVTNCIGSCDFRLLAPAGKQVRLDVISYFSNQSECMYFNHSGVVVYDGLSKNARLLENLCENSDGICPPSLKSSTGSLLIRINQMHDQVVTKMVYDYEDSDSCDGHKCRNGAACFAYTTSYVCKCIEGFTGKYCDVNIDDCKNNPCFFDGHCIDGINGYLCKCRNGSSGKNCEEFIGECYTNPCVYGRCSPISSGFRCTCAAGFTGKRCEYDFNECYSSPCIHGTCTDLVNGYICECEIGFKGNNCDVNMDLSECNTLNCRFGTCAVNESGSFCQCFPGFSGEICDINVDDCASSPCLYGQCIDHVNSYECNCSDGFIGKHCDIYSADPCRGNPCVHGYCSVSKDGFTCVCFQGYSGRKCNRKLLPCDISPCVNGYCINEGHDYRCLCVKGFSGRRCSITNEYCNTSTCINGKCIQTSRETDGVNCNDGQCMPSVEGYICNCSSNYTGNHCERKVDPCSSKICPEYELCVVTDNIAECICDRKFNESNCQRVPMSCDSETCRNGGTCRYSKGNTSFCECAQNFTGDLCETSLPYKHISFLPQISTTEISNRLVTKATAHNPSSNSTEYPVSSMFLTNISEYVTHKPVHGSTIGYKSTPETQSIVSTSNANKHSSSAATLMPNLAVATHVVSKLSNLESTSVAMATIQLTKMLATTHPTHVSTKIWSRHMTDTGTIEMNKVYPLVSNGLYRTYTDSYILSTERLQSTSRSYTHKASVLTSDLTPQVHRSVTSPSFTSTSTSVTNITNTSSEKPLNIIMTDSGILKIVTNSSKPRKTVLDNNTNSLQTLNVLGLSSTSANEQTTQRTTNWVHKPLTFINNRRKLSTPSSTASFVTTIACLDNKCINKIPCLNGSCIYGVCEERKEGTICICEENYSGIDCSVRPEDSDKNDVITIESAIIGALGVLLAVVVSCAIFIFYQYNRRGSVYISSSLFARRRDTAIKKRYSSRDIHSELKAGTFFNPAFDCSIQTDIERKQHSPTPSNIYSPYVTTGDCKSHPPSPGSSKSGNSRSTSSSHGEWYDVVEVPDITVKTIDNPSSSRSKLEIREPTISTNTSPKTAQKKTKYQTRPGLYRADKLEDIPTSVLTSGQQSISTSDKTTTKCNELFVRQDDGTLAFKLSESNRSRTPEEFQTIFEGIFNASDSFTFNNNGKRQCIQLVLGADTGKSDA